MKRTRIVRHAVVTAGLTALLAACSALPGAATSTPAATATPDPCAPENIQQAATELHAFMQAFEDASAIASAVPRSQVAQSIEGLQAIRRDAQNRSVPACLSTLQRMQLAHMNTVIATLLGFLSGGDPNALGQGIDVARQQHDQYILEMARVLGITPAVRPTPAAAAGTTTPAGTLAVGAGATPDASGPSTAAATTGLVASNPGPAAVSIRDLPSETGTVIGLLQPGQTASALATTSDGQWIQVSMPDQPGVTAWVFASTVQLVNAAP